MTTTEAGPLPTPPDFPIEWSDPADEQLFWFQDNLHFPLPITPLGATLFQTAFETGASAAIARLSMPIEALRATVQHGYVYLGPVPVHGDPQTLEARFAEMQRLTMELCPTVLQDWRETFEPQVLAAGVEAVVDRQVLIQQRPQRVRAPREGHRVRGVDRRPALRIGPRGIEKHTIIIDTDLNDQLDRLVREPIAIEKSLGFVRAIWKAGDLSPGSAIGILE